MSIPTRSDDGPIAEAMARAGRALGRRSEDERLFVEERFDVRLDLRSDGGRMLSETATRGAALDGEDSIHITNPSPERIVELAGGEPGPELQPNAAQVAEPWLSGDSGLASAWVAAREAALRDHVQRAAQAIPGAHWSLRLIAFVQSIWVVTPGGHVRRDVRTGRRAEVRLSRHRHPNTESAIDQVFLGEGDDLDRLARRLASAVDRLSRRADDDPPPTAGETVAVLAPGVGGVVAHELIGHALEGDVCLGAETWIRSRPPGPRRSLTILDDPRRGRSPWSIDDEGEASREVTLIDQGVAAGLLLDRSSARAFGASSSGHGRRASYLAPVRPRMGCTWIQPGKDAAAGAIDDTKAGVFIQRMAAGHTDPVKGRASFVVTEAQRIVAGRLDRPLGPFILVLDGPRAWTSIDRVCTDLEFDTCVGSCVREGQPLAVSVGAPTIRIGVVNVVA